MFEENPEIRVVADNKQPDKEQVTIYEKVTLTIKEAAEYSNIGINKIETLLKSPRCPFVLYVGPKNLLSARSLNALFQKIYKYE